MKREQDGDHGFSSFFLYMPECDGHPRGDTQALSVGFSNRPSSSEVRIAYYCVCFWCASLVSARVFGVSAVRAALFPLDSSNLLSIVWVMDIHGRV